MKRVTVDLDEAIYKQLKLAAVERGQSMSDIIRDLLKEEFSEAAQRDADVKKAR